MNAWKYGPKTWRCDLRFWIFDLRLTRVSTQLVND